MKTFRRYTFLYTWLIIFSFLASCQTQTQERTSEQETATVTEATPSEDGYKVVAIKDGDTIELLKDGKPVRVRLQGVDCPEKNQDFGTRARQFTSDLCFGKYVQLEVVDTDRYGRTVGIITLPDGRILNNELVKNGFAWHYKAYSKDPELAVLEEEARSQKAGLWAGPNPVAPWDFRKEKRTGSSSSATANNSSNETETTTSKNSTRSTGKVYLCDSQGASTYHIDQNCRALSSCKSQVVSATKSAATSKGRKACRVCAS